MRQICQDFFAARLLPQIRLKITARVIFFNIFDSIFRIMENKIMRFLITLLFLCTFITINASAAEIQPDSSKTFLAANSSNKFDCKKKYCKKMRSCAEACYKFKVCGHKRLDRDRDKIPCENICKRPCKLSVPKS